MTKARTLAGVVSEGSPLADGTISAADVGGLDASLDTKLPLAGGTMTGAISFAAGQTWPTFNQNTTGSAATLATGRTIGMTGDVTWTSAAFNGSANVTGTATLANSGVTAGTYTKVTVDAKGRATSGTTLSASDIPNLDASKITSGVLDAARLPSYVDDVLEYANLASFPASGETGKIYVALDTNKTYRWSGSSYVYITSGAVDSVAGKTGVVTLTSSDVGLGNVENKSSATIRGELTSGNVTTALGFTPYNASNPSGFISGITSGMVTTALGYTPYNATNPSGYITSAALSSYLPLSGGTITGNLVLSTGYIDVGSDLYARGNIYSLNSASNGWNNVFNRNGGSPFINNVTYAGNTILHAGNSTSYASASAPLLSAVSSYSFSASTNGRDFNQGVQAGFVSDGQGYPSYGSVVRVKTYSNDGGTAELYFPYSATYGGSAMRYRLGQYDNAGWTAWKTVLDSGNYSSYALPLSGGTLSGNLSINSGVVINFAGQSDTVGYNATAGLGTYIKGTGNTYVYGGGSFYDGSSQRALLHAGNYSSYALPLSGGTLTGVLSSNKPINLGNATYSTQAVLVGNWSGAGWWGLGSESGHIIKLDQVATTDTAAPTWVGATDVTLKLGTKTVLDSGNYTSYSPSLTGSGASGTWGINVTGSAGSLSDTSNYMVGRGSYSSGSVDSITGLGVWNQNNVGDSHTVLVFGQGGSTSTVQQRFHYTGSMEFRNRTDSASWTAWKTVLHSGNYTSYSPSLTGSGASGTWGISITGNAATAYGLDVHTGRNNEANKVVRTDGSGYIQAGWINTTSGDSGVENRLTRIYSSYDGYVRFSTLTDFKVHMGLSAKNNYSRRIDYTSDSNYWVGSMGHSGYGANEVFHGGSGFFDIWSGTNYPSGTSHIHGFNALHYTVNSLGSTGGNAYGIQVAGQYNLGGEIWSRGCSGGTFSAWRRQLDDSNYTSYSPSLTGSGASGTWGISITGDANTVDGHDWFSYGKNIRGSDIYADSWLRNYNSGTGLYNQATGNHWYSDGAYWNVGYSGTTGIRLRNGHAGTILGYLYGETDGNFGLLHNGGGWAVQVYPGGGGYLHGTWNGGNLRANRANGNFYIDDNYGYGIVGAYSSYRYQGVFAMGDSYKLPADGTTTGSLYGMAWAHPNAGGVAGNLDSHGMIVMINGGFGSCMSYSIRASGNVTAYSDERLKTNWRDMPENYVARLAQVKVGIYDRVDGEQITQVGVSAQSLQSLLPQAITTAKDEMGTLAVSYGNAALASAVELAKDNVELRARIERLESLIEQLLNKE